MDDGTQFPAVMLSDPLTQVPVEWRIAPGLTPYPEAVAFMEDRAAAIAARSGSTRAWRFAAAGARGSSRPRNGRPTIRRTGVIEP